MSSLDYELRLVNSSMSTLGIVSNLITISLLLSNEIHHGSLGGDLIPETDLIGS